MNSPASPQHIDTNRTAPGNVPRLEIRIPASPNDRYMRMLRYFLESLQAFGGPVGRSAHTVVSIGSEEPQRDVYTEYPWALDYSVEFQWLDQALFRRHAYEATGFHRLWIQSDADVIILADADILIAGDFDNVIIDVFHRQVLLGFIAHVSPFTGHSSKYWWNRIFESADLPPPGLDWQHTGWGLMSTNPDQRYCPAYFNYGFIVAPRHVVDLMGRTFVGELDHVDSVFESTFKSQIANTLCFARHNISVDTLPINYNFPLHVDCNKIRQLNPDPSGKTGWEDIKVFHYLGSGEVNKEHFESDETLAIVLQRRDLSEAGRMFQSKLKVVHERIAGSKQPGLTKRFS